MEVITQKIADLLEQSIGLTVTSIGASTFKRALNNRKKVLGISDDAAYLEKLTVSFMELRRLVEEVVVPETWFFRDQEPFTYLAEYVYESTKDFSIDILRVLSLPCSTGEEPYSIAMTLLQAGLKPTSFYVDGVDVSGRSLAVARTGIYTQNSFRTEDIEFRDTFFHKTEDGYSLTPMVREKVRFIRGNILQPGFLDSLGRYDVVFCRNLLIYFDRDAQKQTVRGLHGLLMPEGVLFAGHSEASLFMESRFVPVSHSRAFAFRKKDLSSVVPGPLEQERKKLFSTPSVTVAGASRPVKRPRPVLTREPGILKSEKEDEFAYVQKLADAGNLDEAVKLCEKNLQQVGPSAEWYYLLGVVRTSQGQQQEALKYFRKAVYLDPGNVESLIQLSLLAEREGNIDTAENYKRRARMIQEQG